MSETDLDANDREVRAQAEASIGAALPLLDDMLLHLNHGMSALTGRAQDRGLNFLVSLLLVRTFNSLARARKDAVDGYPVQALALARTAIEDWVTAVHVEQRPDRVDRWLAGLLSEYKEAKSPIDFATMFSEIADPLVRAKADETYDVLSKFAHPNGGGLRYLIHWDVETTFLHFGGYFDPRALRLCFYFLLTLAQMSLERVAQLQYRVLGDVDQEWLERGNQLTERGIEFLEQVHRDLGSPAKEKAGEDQS